MGFQIVPLRPRVILVGSPGAPAFNTGWATRVGFGHLAVGFWREANGIVHLQGSAERVSGELVIFTLPPGYRPGATVNLRPAGTASTDIPLTVATNGEVSIFALAGNAPVSLDGVSFHPGS